MHRSRKRVKGRGRVSAKKLFQSFFVVIPEPVLGWMAIFWLILLTAVSIMAGAGRILNLAFPAGTCAVGLLLYTRYPILYVGFVWWIWFLSPLVRRLADYTGGSFTEPSPILLSPYLVVSISFLTLWHHLPRSRREGTLPFVFILSSLFYSLAIGINLNPLTQVVIEFLDFAAPVLFSFYLFINWRRYPLFKKNIQRVFFWGVLVIGIYGIIQYLIVPEWDRFWVIQSKMASAGTPEPFLMNVHSTLNDRGACAVYTMVGLLVLLNNPYFSSVKGFWGVLVGPFAYLTLLLTRVRTAWASFLIGLIVLWNSLSPKMKTRLVFTFLVMALCFIPLANTEYFSNRISDRVSTFSNLEEDNSFQARQGIYQRNLTKALFSFVGSGMGTRFGDSGILSMLYTLGWIGVILYGIGLIQILLAFFQKSISQIRFDQFIGTARAIVVSILVMMPIGNTLKGVAGFAFWTFLGLGMAACKYHQNKHLTETSNFSHRKSEILLGNQRND